VTRLLHDWRSGDAGALEELIPLVYAELHRIATAFMRGERKDHTFRPTDLLGEAYLRLAEASSELNDRVHFFAIAARTMRQILVDHARAKNAVKRGDGERPVTFDEVVVATDRSAELIALDDALAALTAFDERKARVVELHYFGGLTHDEIAEVLEVHKNTVGRDLRLAEAWMRDHLADA